ncbi:MAG: 2-hydroxy-3-oxopropionate reductase [Anaerolineae bacterium]|nr:2-hydroxy-3-oxopropionate reductase [Anaerolineae bacterium]
MPERVGFIGLGIMGKPMARHILEAGYPLTVHNRSRGAVDELAGLGATPARSAAEVAAVSDIVFTCLPDSPDVEAVALGEAGISSGIRPGSIYVDTSTISPVTTKRVARAMQEKGVRMLDAPVSGGQIGAENATLAIMVGGEEDAFERVRPILEVIGKNIVYVGPSGAGQVTKAANQIVVGLTHAAVAEALVLAAKSGVDPAKVVQAISGGAARCWALENRAPKVLQRDFEPGFYAAYHLKDLGIALEAARESGAVLPATALVRQMYQSLVTHGKGRLDHSAIIQVIEGLSDVEVRGGTGG